MKMNLAPSDEILADDSATNETPMLPPFPYFGGKRSITAAVWERFGKPKQYIEPFCGSAAMLLAAPHPSSLEVIGDRNGFIANFWRAVKNQPAAVAEWADYPVSHIDLGARHGWLMAQRGRVGDALQDAEWPGDAQVAGWWLWGQCSWIGSGWCEWERQPPHVSNTGQGVQAIGKIPHVSNAGQGVQAIGQIPHVSNAGQGGQAIRQITVVSNAGQGGQAIRQITVVSNAGRGEPTLLTSGGSTAWRWLHLIAARTERVRIIHGDWHRCLNHHYGKDNTAVFLDPPYKGYDDLYGAGVGQCIAEQVCEWAKEHGYLRIALCGHEGDYDLPGWETVQWARRDLTYGSSKTRDVECVWYSPGCLPGIRAAARGQLDLVL